jgi:hypothetical protein
MNRQVGRQVSGGFLSGAVRSAGRVGGGHAKRLLPLAVALMAANLWGQLKTSVYAQPPAVVVEPVIVKPSGIYPRQIVRPQGPFVLYIDNRLPGHAGHFSLTLDQDKAPELSGLDTNALKSRSSILLDPLPGTYRLQIQTSDRKSTGLSLVIQITK